MANPQSTQRLRQLFSQDEDDKKRGDGSVRITTAPQQTDFSRGDNVANSLRDNFAGFGESAPSRQPKEESQPVEQVEFSESQKRPVFDWKAGGEAALNSIKSIPSQTIKGLNMIFTAPEKLAQGASDQLMKIDSYNQFMTDAARGIDLGEGRAAIGILNTAALGIGDVKPIMNTETGKKIIEKQGQYTSNFPLKTVARFRALGDETYAEVRDRMLEDRYNEDNSNLKKFLYDLQDSGVQSVLGILITMGTVAATHNPKAGYAVGGIYYAGLSANEQLQERGEVYSSGNIAIDVVGETLINNALLGVFKMPASALARIPATAGLEGTTEVVQSLLKFQNSYIIADSDEEREAVLEDAANYWKSGAWWREFGVGAVVGGGAQTVVEVSGMSPTEVANTRSEISNSLAFPIDESIEAGDVKAGDVYQNALVAPEGTVQQRIEAIQGNPEGIVLYRGQDTGSGGNRFTDNPVWAQNFGGQDTEVVSMTLPADAEIKVLSQADAETAVELGLLNDEDIYNYFFEQGADVLIGTDSRNSGEVEVIVKPELVQGTEVVNTSDQTLTPEFAQGRIDDIAQKLGKLDPQLEQQFRAEADVENATMEGLIELGNEVLQRAVPAQNSAEEVTNTAGTEGTGETPAGVGNPREQITDVADLIARADRGETLTDNEQIALRQARQSFNDYSQTFQVTQFSIPNEVTGKGDIALVQTVEVGDKVAVKYVADVGETGLNIDYDLNTLYNSPQEATDAAIASIATWIESQLENPFLTVSAVQQRRLEDLAKKVRDPRQAAPETPLRPIPPEIVRGQLDAPVATDNVQVTKFAVGNEVTLEGTQYTVRTVDTESFGETRYIVEDGEGNTRVLNDNALESENKPTNKSKKTTKKTTKKTAKTKAETKKTDKKETTTKKKDSSKKEKTDDVKVDGLTDAENRAVNRSRREGGVFVVTAEDTVEALQNEKKPLKAETVKKDAKTLTIVLTDGETELEGVARPDQKVSKTKLKDFLVGRDQAVFTVLEGDVVDGEQRVILYEKRENGETKLRPEALGLIPQNLEIGQEVILNASTLKGKGNRFAAEDSDGNVLADAIPSKVLLSDEKATKAVVQYQSRATREQREALLTKPFITWLKAKRIGRNELGFDKEGYIELYRAGELVTGRAQSYSQQPVWDNQKKVRVHYTDVLLNFDSSATRGLYEQNLTGLEKEVAFEQLENFADFEGYEVLAITPPQSRRGVSQEGTRLRDKSTGRFVSKAQARKLADGEFADISRRVKKAEPAGKTPSILYSREPSKDSKIGDAAMNEEALKKGDAIEYDKLVKRSEIERVLKSKLNVIVRSGKFRAQALGVYKPNTDTIRMSKKAFSSREGGSLTTLIHEIGHYIDYSLMGKIRDRIPRTELKPLLENYGNGDAPQGKKHIEAFAEFIRYYVTMPAEAKARAPKFHKIFTEELEKYPEIRDTLNNAAHEFRRWAEQPSTAKVAAQISFEQENKESIGERFNATIHDIYKTAVNDLHAIDQFSAIAKKSKGEIEADNDPAILARNMRGWIGRAQYFLENGTTNREYWKKGDNGRFYVDKKGKSLKEILQPVENKNALNDLSVYLVSRRAIELADRGITSGVTKEDAEVALAEMTEKYPEFSQVAQDLDTYQNHLLDYLEQSDVLNKKDRAKMQEMNKMYTPFYRVQEELTNQGYMGGKKIPTRNPIKRIKGSEKDIIDPIESIVKNTYVLMNAAERNNVMLAMANLAEDDPKLGRLFEKVPVDQTKVASVNAKDIVDQALGIEKMFIDPRAQAALDLLVPDKMVDIFRPAFMQKGNVVSVLRDGKPVYYELDKDLYDAIQSTEVEEVIAAVKILSYPAQFLRAGATLTPEFMVRNPLRDSITAGVFSKNGFVPFWDTARGFASLIKKDEYYDAFVMSGGLQSTIVAQDRENLKKSKAELLKRSERIKKYVKNPLEVLQVISQYTEQATRIGEARLALNRGKSPTQAAFDSREITLDFQRAGAKTRSINKLSAFFNAKIQGNDKLIRTFIEQPAKATLKASLYITLPSVILWFLNQDEEGWDEIPQWQKDIFWLVKVDDTWYRIPKPFELGVLFGSIPERFLDYLKDNDPEGLKEVARSFTIGLVPNPTPTGAVPVIENITNYSFFLDRPIVSRGLENLPPADQYSQTTSETSKLIGEAINYSPAKIDNLIYGYFAGLGRHVVNTLDATLKGTGIVHSVPEPSPTLADQPVIKAFVVRDPAGSSSNSVNEFYEARTKATQHYNKFNDLLEEGRGEEAREYLADHPDIKFYSAYNQMASTISEIRKARDVVYNSETLTPEQKREKVDELNQLMTDVAYRAINIELK